MASARASVDRSPGAAPEILVFTIVGSAYLLLASYGTLQPLGEEHLSAIFDHLGRSLADGEATVPLNPETLRVDGRDFVYFGPLPALLRIPANALFPAWFGQWGRIATLVAGLAALAAWLRIVRTAAPTLGPSARALLGLGFGLGTPLVFLVSAPFVWHEAIAIALATSLWAVSYWLELLVRGRTTPGVWLGLGTAIALTYLTRLTFAVPHLAIIGAVAALAVLGVRGDAPRRVPVAVASLRRRASTAALALPVLAALLYQGWYNLERFGSPLVYTSHRSQLAYAANPALLAHHESIGTFNPWRIPVSGRHYLGLHGRIDGTPPFVHVARNRDLPDDLYFTDHVEWTISLWIVSGWLLGGAAWGVVGLARERRLLELAAAAAFAMQLGVILTYYWLSQRLSAELLPGLCWSFAFALPALAASRRRRAIGAVLVALSIGATLASTLSWQASHNMFAPPDYREALRTTFGTAP